MLWGSDGAFYGTTSKAGGGRGMVFRFGPAGRPPLTSPRIVAGSFTFDFLSQFGVSYPLQSATSLPAANWLDEGAPCIGTGAVLATHIPVKPETEKFFV